MTDEERAVLQGLLPLVQLKNIFLFSSRFERPTQPAQQQVSGVQQHLLSVASGGGQLVRDDGTVPGFQARISLGTRIVEQRSPDSTGPDAAGQAAVLFLIEATFLAEYELASEVSEDALHVFARYNSVHNVWPFWRQHVFDIVQRGLLPQLDIPLMSAGQPL